MKSIFEGIEAITFAILNAPFDAIREMELSSWFLANGANWIFVIIGFAALFYWLKELKRYSKEDTDDKTSTSHSFLG